MIIKKCLGCGKEKRGEGLLRWKRENPELAKYYQKQASLKGAEWVKQHPEHQSIAGKARGKQLSKDIEHQRKAGFQTAKHRKISKIEQKMKDILASDFVHNELFMNTLPDFRSEKRKVIIEVDGSHWHNMKRNHERDLRYNAVWISHGYVPMRFTDKDIKRMVI